MLALLLALLLSTELDLPVLPPDDPRREEYTGVPIPPPEVRTPAPPPVFYAESIQAEGSLIYVLDFSGSMGRASGRYENRKSLRRWEVAVREARRSIRGLAASFEFGVVVFGVGGGCGVALWQPELVPATDARKAEACGWLGKFTNAQVNGGATPTGPAVLLALALEPEVVVLLTDGDPSTCGVGRGSHPSISHRRLIADNNPKPVPIHVFGVQLGSQYAERFCRGVASDSTGTFTEAR